MKDSFRMLAVLTAFGLGSGLLLAWTYNATREPIERAKRQETIAALKKVLPECDKDVAADSLTIEDSGETWKFYVARRNGEYAGAATLSSAPGYGGDIEVMIGFDREGLVNDVAILLADKETPGLGSRIKEPAFLAMFKGRGSADTRWCNVSKDGGELDAITGATISSRAAAKAVRSGADAFAKHVSQLATNN